MMRTVRIYDESENLISEIVCDSHIIITSDGNNMHWSCDITLSMEEFRQLVGFAMNNLEETAKRMFGE